MDSRRAMTLAAGMLICATVACGDDDRDTGRAKFALPEAINGFIGGASKIDAGGFFSEPSDVAVYVGGRGTGDHKIFVAEADAGRSARVQRLDGDGNFELAWGRDVVRAGEPGDRGDRPELCRRASSCKKGPPGSAAGAFRRPTGIAVDDDTGHVYVADTGNRRVQEFTSSGGFVRAWGWGVATGAARFEICVAGCRAGRHGSREGDDNPGQLATATAGGIAVDPGRSDVLVSDGGNSRVMQFASDGRFLRAWGHGVATGSSRFETCTADDGCRAGKAGDPRWVAARGWPRQLAIDADGIVYAADARDHNRLVRFDLDAAPAGGDAEEALLTPLPSGRPSGADNMGFDIDRTTGSLVALWNPFGPALIDVVREPGETGEVDWGAKRSRMSLGFVGSVYGLATNPTTGVVYLAQSERLNLRDAASMFSACPARGAPERACHGLAVLGGAAAPRAKLGRPRRDDASSATLSATVTAPGAARYAFQVSRPGGPWRDVHPPRYLTAAEARSVRAAVHGLARDADYRARIRVTWLDARERAPQRFTSRALPIQ